MDDLHHPLDLLGGDGPRAGLLAQQVHHVRRELIAGLGKGVPIKILIEFKGFFSNAYLLIFIELLVVDVANLGKLSSVV